jgi:predicted metal-dependent phosphoesterase TrpH
VRIDLHTHSTASDGTDTPAELVRAAAAAGLDVVALTDHDTTGGWAEAVAALPPGLTLLRGAELSCVSLAGPRPITLHLLAYLFDPADPAFVAERRRLRESRLDRGRRIVELLAADGYPVDWPAVRELAGGGAVGRPHVARALIRAGVVSTVDEAFGRLLSPGSPYYVSKADTEVLAGIRMVRAAGGVPVFAHPLARRRGRVVSDEVIAAMAEAGLAGLEADHPDHEPDDREHLRVVAAGLGLFVTGSSDYHGGNKAVRLGQEGTSAAGYERLVEQASGLAPVSG